MRNRPTKTSMNVDVAFMPPLYHNIFHKSSPWRKESHAQIRAIDDRRQEFGSDRREAVLKAGIVQKEDMAQTWKAGKER